MHGLRNLPLSLHGICSKKQKKREPVEITVSLRGGEEMAHRLNRSYNTSTWYSLLDVYLTVSLQSLFSFAQIGLIKHQSILVLLIYRRSLIRMIESPHVQLSCSLRSTRSFFILRDRSCVSNQGNNQEG